jgi:DNA polymerase I-like protein with 3'-5' exonuclease and polymerase domains
MVPIEHLLQQAQAAGVTFGLAGGQIRVSRASRLPADLRDTLRTRRQDLWIHLGGSALDAPPILTLHQLKVQLLLPATLKELDDALEQIEADSTWHTPAELRDRPSLVGFDIETAALPGTEVRPPIKLKKNGEPAKVQPAFTGTAALDPHRSRIRLVQLYGGGDACLVVDTDVIPLDAFLQAQCRRHTLIIHNAAFELRHLGEAGIEVPYFEDTMQAAGLLLGVRRRSLDAVAEAYLGISLSKALQTSDWSAPRLSEGQYAYAAADAIVAFRAWLQLRNELIQQDRGAAYQLQRDVTRVAVKMTTRGITLDRGRHQQQIEEWRLNLAAANRAFVEEAKHDLPQTPEQVRAFLKLTLPPNVLAGWPATPKNGALSTRAAQLRRITHLPAMRALLEYKAMEKLLSSFGDDLLAKISARTGRLHPGLSIASTKTGRSSSSNPNIQQLPKHKSPALRSALIAAPGHLLVIADFNAMELRAAAEVSDDQVMRQDFADGVDLHRRQAAAMLGIPEDQVAAVQRDSAKPINFGVIYGAGPAGLVASAWNGYGVILTLDEAAAGRSHFLSRYHAFARWMRAHYERCTTRGRIEIGTLGRAIEAVWEAASGSGRGYRPNNDADDDWDDEDDFEFFEAWASSNGWAADQLKYTLCCNAPIQGACADVGMLSLLLFDAAVRREGIIGEPVLFIHDEIVAEIRSDQAEAAAALLKASMEQAFAAVFPKAPLRDLVELRIGPHWGKGT